MAHKIDFEVFTPYWEALKRALITVNLHGGGIGETGRAILTAGPAVSGESNPSEESNIDISDGYAAFTLYFTNQNLFDPTPTMMFTNSLGDEFIREEDPIRMPDKDPAEETLKSQTLRWIDLINVRMVETINEVHKGRSLALELQRTVTPVLHQLFDEPLPTAPPDMLQTPGSLIYDVNRNFILVGIHGEPLISLP